MVNFPTTLDNDASLHVAKNNLYTTLLAQLLIGETISMTVGSTSSWDSSGYLSVDNEIIHYASVDGAHFMTLTRAQDGTSAAQHEVGTIVELRPIAMHHNDPKDAIVALETKVGVNSSAVITTLDYLLKSSSSVDPGHLHKAPLTATGDIIVGGASGVWGKLAVGGANTLLHGGTTPAYSAVVENDISLSAVSTNDASVTKHGFLSQLPGGTTVFLRGDGAFASPASVTVPYAYFQEGFAYTAGAAHNIVHSFGTYPVVQAFDSSGYMVIPQVVQNINVNTVAVTFATSETFTLVLTVGSPPFGNYTSITGTYAIQTLDETVDALSGTFTATLPTAVGVKGKVYNLKNSGTGAVTIACTGGQTIDGDATQVLLSKDEMTIQSNDTNWIVVNYFRKFRQTEIDFGATPVEVADIIITDAGINTGSRITGQIAYVAPTGKEIDELEFDAFDLRFAPGAGQCTLHITSLEGLVADKFVIYYSYN